MRTEIVFCGVVPSAERGEHHKLLNLFEVWQSSNIWQRRLTNHTCVREEIKRINN